MAALPLSSPANDPPEVRPARAPHSVCLSCGCELRVPLFRKAGYRYVECPGCGLAHLDPIPDERHAQAVFGPSYFAGSAPGGYCDYAADEPLHRLNARIRIAAVRRALGHARPGAWLDVGCAHGFLLDEARRKGWRVRGVEIAGVAADHARRELGLDVDEDLRRIAEDAPASFDVVSLYQVLEHVPHPAETLALARGCVVPGGLIVVETWDRRHFIPRLLGRWWQDVAPPSVIWLFNRLALRRLFARAGLRAVRFRAGAKYVRLGFAGSLLAAPGNRWFLAALGRGLQAAALRDRPVLYRFGDLVTVTATVPGACSPRGA